MNEDGWFSDLYERNYALLYRIGRVFLGGGAREALIEDQIQEAFVRAWQKRGTLQKLDCLLAELRAAIGDE